MNRKIILSLMVAAGMQSAFAGSEQLTVTFSGEVMPACEVTNGGNLNVDFGNLPTGDVYTKEVSFDYLCTNNTIIKIYPVNQFTYQNGAEALKFSVFNGWGFDAGSTNLDNGISQTNPIGITRSAGSVFATQQQPLVIAVQGEGDDKMNSFGSFSLGKKISKAQSFSVSIPMMIEYE